MGVFATTKTAKEIAAFSAAIFGMFFAYKANVVFFCAVFFEIFFLSVFGFKKKIALLPSAIIGVQIASVLCIGTYIPELLLSNIGYTNDVGIFIILKSSVLFIIGTLFSFTIITSTPPPRKQIKITLFLIFVLINYFVITTPIVSFFYTLGSHFSCSLVKFSPAKKDRQAVLYKKDFIYDENELSRETPDLRNKNIIVFLLRVSARLKSTNITVIKT